MNPIIYDVVIIGAGPSGLTAGIYTSRAGLKTLIIAGTKWGGQLQLTTMVENYPGFSQGIQGPLLMQEMRRQAERFGAEILDKDATKIDFSQKPFSVKTGSKNFTAKAIIIATGVLTKWLGVSGEKNLIGKGVSSCATCDAFFYKEKKVIVAGGGDSAMEDALSLAKFALEVTIIHRRDKFRASQIMQDRVLKNSKIKVIWNTQIKEIIGKEKVTAVKLETKDKGEWVMPTDGVFVAIGHLPNSSLFKEINIDKEGFIRNKIVFDKGLVKYHSATNIDGVFVSGDVYDRRYKQAVVAAGSGCISALDAEKWLSEAHE